jgi:hypothetical protein
MWWVCVWPDDLPWGPRWDNPPYPSIPIYHLGFPTWSTPSKLHSTTNLGLVGLWVCAWFVQQLPGWGALWLCVATPVVGAAAGDGGRRYYLSAASFPGFHRRFIHYLHPCMHCGSFGGFWDVFKIFKFWPPVRRGRAWRGVVQPSSSNGSPDGGHLFCTHAIPAPVGCQCHRRFGVRLPVRCLFGRPPPPRVSAGRRAPVASGVATAFPPGTLPVTRELQP